MGFSGPCPLPCCEGAGLFNGSSGYCPCSSLDGSPLCSFTERTHDSLAKGRPQQYPGDRCAIGTAGGVAEGLWEGWPVSSQDTISKTAFLAHHKEVTKEIVAMGYQRPTEKE